MHRKTVPTALAILVLLVFLAPGCGPGERAPAKNAEPAAAPGGVAAPLPVEVLLGLDPEAPPEALERARGATRELLTTLEGKLVAAMQEGGPEAALGVCHEVAQQVAASFQRDGLEIRRVTLKVRNPKDAPDPREAELLRQLEQAKAAGTMPGEVAQVVVDEGGKKVLRYAKPLLVGGACLACHGGPEEIPPGVRRKLAELYPADRATGYRKGDLRGIVSVTVRLD